MPFNTQLKTLVSHLLQYTTFHALTDHQTNPGIFNSTCLSVDTCLVHSSSTLLIMHYCDIQTGSGTCINLLISCYLQCTFSLYAVCYAMYYLVCIAINV